MPSFPHLNNSRTTPRAEHIFDGKLERLVEPSHLLLEKRELQEKFQKTSEMQSMVV